MTVLDEAQDVLDDAHNLGVLSPSLAHTLQSLIETVHGELDGHLFASLHILREDAEWAQAMHICNDPPSSCNMEDAIMHPAGNEEEGEVS